MRNKLIRKDKELFRKYLKDFRDFLKEENNKIFQQRK